MNLHHVETLDAKTLQARLGRGHHVTGDVAKVFRANLDLGIQQRARAKFLQRASQVALGDAISVVRRIVEIINPEFERARHDARLFPRVAADHQTGVAAAAKADDGKLETGFANSPVLHAASPSPYSAGTFVFFASRSGGYSTWS